MTSHHQAYRGFGMMCIWIAVMAILAPFQAEADIGRKLDDRTRSPYFFIQSDDPETDRLPLKSTKAAVRIAGVTADVTVTQVYKNEGRKTLEAIYIFPGSTRAAVYAMRMQVGDRVIDAEIMEREKARETYEKARDDGRTAGLLEQERPNVFQMSVANVLPGDEIRVELKYTELLEREGTTYEFVYPAVVGPRYSHEPAETATERSGWVKNPYLHEGQSAPYDFDLALELNTGIPIAELTSPATSIDVEYANPREAKISLKNKAEAALTDFVLRYRLADETVRTGLLLYPGKDENYFLMMMEPPAKIATDTIVPREYMFIVDVSGSMNGFPLEKVGKPLMRDIIGNLRARDYMNVLLFSGGSAMLAEGGSLPASEKNKRKAIEWMNSRQGGGGTEIFPALKRALNMPRTEGASRIVVVVTDGYVTVEPEVFELIRKNLGQANLFAFGIGSSVNRHLIEGMARVGLGEPFIVMTPEEGSAKAEKFREYIRNPILTDIRVRFNGFDAYDVEPPAVPDLFAARPITVFGKYRNAPTGAIEVTGRTASGPFKQVLPVRDGVLSDENAALRLLWARHRIMRLADMDNLEPDDRCVKEITRLGIQYSLMTPYTSFVAVDKIKRATGELVTVKQPLPLPRGVSDLAVADRVKRSAGRLGQGMFKSMYLAESAPAPTTVQPKPTVGNGNKEEDDQVDPSLRDSLKSGRLTLTMEEIRNNLDMVMIMSGFELIMKPLSACIPSGRSGEVTIKLVVDSHGQLTGEAVSSSNVDKVLETCFLKTLEGLRLSSGPGEILIRLNW
jgi:Ca-activated chloride channel homolog